MTEDVKVGKVGPNLAQKLHGFSKRDREMFYHEEYEYIYIDEQIYRYMNTYKYVNI